MRTLKIEIELTEEDYILYKSSLKVGESNYTIFRDGLRVIEDGYRGRREDNETKMYFKEYYRLRNKK